MNELEVKNIALQKELDSFRKVMTEFSTEVQRHKYIIQKLHQVSVKLNSALELPNILEAAIEAITSVVQANRCSVFQFFPQDRSIQLMHHAGLDKPTGEAPQRINVAESRVIAKAVAEDHDLLIADIEHELQLPNLSNYQSSSFMIFLMKRENELLGIVNVNDRVDGHPFTDWDFQLGQMISQLLATAFSNAQLYERVKLESITDSLTQLYTHGHFQEMLSHETALAERYGGEVSLIMMDIDHFKHFNDTYGHQTGDLVLASLAQSVKKQLRQSDRAFRYGGEEFAIVLPRTDMDGALVMAERVRSVIENMKIPSDQKKLHVTISLGVGQYDKGTNKKQLVEKTDQALYQAKLEGRNRVIAAKSAP